MDFEGSREGEDKEGQREEGEEMGKRREGKEEEKGEEEEEERAEEGVERVANAQDNTNDVVVMSRSKDRLHLSTTTNNQSVGPHNLPTPTTSSEPVPTNPSAHPESVQLPGLWCNPVTVTLEQVEENT